MIDTTHIQRHIRSVLAGAKKKRAIIAVSGGIDSATALYLLAQTIPVTDIFVMHLPYFPSSVRRFEKTIETLSIPKQNSIVQSIKNSVDAIAQSLALTDSAGDKIRLGNIMARTRMIYLFDLAKKHDALVCGTENRTEMYLGYFTRYGDAASDFEIINHLYKTQVRELAGTLGVPQEIIDAEPSAGLWDGQTDEKELGFSYEEIDRVLTLHFDENFGLSDIISKGNPHAEEILRRVKSNHFKQEVPYTMD